MGLLSKLKHHVKKLISKRGSVYLKQEIKEEVKEVKKKGKNDKKYAYPLWIYGQRMAGPKQAPKWA